jgi:hypothetical protein
MVACAAPNRRNRPIRPPRPRSVRESGGSKSEAPRVALLAEAGAPPGATPSGNDPPPIDLRALAFVSTNVIARRSKLRRAIPFSESSHLGFPSYATSGRSPRTSPGCPGSGGTTVLVPLPRSPGAASLAVGPSPPTPLPTSWTRLDLRSVPSVLPPRRHLGPVPRAPVGVALTGMDHTVHPPKYLVKGYFSYSQGYPPTNPLLPRISFVIHRSSTGHPQLAH